MKIFKFTVTVLLTLCVIFAAAGCGSGGGDINTDSLLEKDAIEKATQRYEAASVKRSDFNYSVKLSFFSDNTALQSDKGVREISIGQTLGGSRIQNNGKKYLDVSLRSSSVNKNMLNAINFAQSLAGLLASAAGSDDSDEFDLSVPAGVMQYVKSESFFAAKIGYENGVYNALGDYCFNEETPDYTLGNNVLWGATTDTEIGKFASEGIETSLDVNFSEMFTKLNFVFDLTQAAGWITQDTAESKYSVDDNSFLYDLTLSKDKIKEYLFSQLDSVAESMDPEEWASGIETYNFVMEKVKKWVTVFDGKVKAKVAKDGSLSALDTQTVVDVNINVNEAISILTELQEEDEFQSIIGILTFLSKQSFFADSTKSGVAGIWTVRATISTSETFSYDEVSTDLSAVDTRLFESFETEPDGRYELKYRPFGER